MQRLSVALRLGGCVARCAECGEDESVDFLGELVQRNSLLGLDRTDIIEETNPEFYESNVRVELVDTAAEHLARRSSGGALGPRPEVDRCFKKSPM
jgi:hypothetical protein